MMELTGYIEIHIQLISRIMKKDLNLEIRGKRKQLPYFTVYNEI